MPKIAITKYREIKCAIIRGGTSKGIFLEIDDLPSDRKERNTLLQQLLGSDSLQIDGLGGGNSLTSKIALVAPSKKAGVDLDYQFVQVMPGRGIDDAIPCGNILAGVGGFACDCQLIETTDPMTTITIHDVNTGSIIEQDLQTPNGKITFDGSYIMPGIDRPSAPVELRYKKIAGLTTGKLWPTGNVVDMIDGIPVTLIDAAIPVMIVSVPDISKNLTPNIRELYSRAFIDHLLDLRAKISKLGGININGRAIPKIAVVRENFAEGDIYANYFTPFTPHRSIAVTGAISIATAMVAKGSTAHTVANNHFSVVEEEELKITIEHLAGSFTLEMEFKSEDGHLYPESASIVRNARMLMKGTAFISA